MKILIVSQRYDPEQFQINEIAPELVRRGHEVTVLTGVPNYPQGEIYSGYEKGKRREEVIGGVRVIRVRERPRKHGKFNLFLNYLTFAFFGGLRARRLPGDFDLVLCYQLSPVSMLHPAIVYAKKYGKPLLCYCLDIWPESAKDHMPIRFVYRMIGAYARRVYAACDRIAVTSVPFMEYLTRVDGVDPEKMEYIPQHADSSMCGMDLSAEENGVADFLYAGNFGKAQTLQVLIRAVAELKERRDSRVHMVGDGSRREELETLAQELGVSDKFIFYGNQPRAKMPDFYRKADALILTLRGNNEVGNTMPGKLQTYMTVGKPIFGAINGAADQVIREADCGKCVAAGDWEGLARIMLEYMDHPERFSACGENARAYFGEHFTFEIYMNALEGAMERTIRQRKDRGRA